MIAAEQAFISGTTLTQFVSAAYACSPGSKHIFGLYGLRQQSREVTDRLEYSEKYEVVVLGALPLDVEDIPAECSQLGFLTICQAPVHKLSYADTQRLRLARRGDDGKAAMLLHLTKLESSDGITRVFYSLYESRPNSCDSLQSVKLTVDNLVDSMQGFTKIASVFTRYLAPTAALIDAKRPAEPVNCEKEVNSCHDLEMLARERAALVARIVELTSQLSTKGMTL